MTGMIIGIVVGLAVGVLLFGGIFLLSVLPGRKKKSESAPAPAEDVKPAEAEEEKDEAEAEKLDEKLEEEQEEEQPEEEAQPEEQPEEEQPEEEEVVEEAAAAEAVEEEEEVEEEVEPSEETVAALAAEKADDTVRLDKSFKARLIQADDAIKDSYAAIKETALSYKGARSYPAWKQERIKCGRKIIAKFVMRGKTLCLYLPLDPKDYENTGYKVEDVGGKSVNADTPLLLRIKNNRRTRQAQQLVAAVAEKAGIEPSGKKVEDCRKGLAYRTDAYLMEKGLIKVVTKTAYPEKK